MAIKHQVLLLLVQLSTSINNNNNNNNISHYNLVQKIDLMMKKMLKN